VHRKRKYFYNMKYWELKWVDSAGDYFYWLVEAKDAGIESGGAISNSNAETILKATASIV
jgi:hypothetical protein